MDATSNTLSFPGQVKSIYKEAKGEYLKNLKIIVVLREPVSRELSLYNRKLYEYLQTKDKKQWYSDVAKDDGSVSLFVEHAEFIIRQIKNPDPGDLERGLEDTGFYAKHLSRWLEFLDRKQLLAISYDEFKEDAKAVEDRIRKFLGFDFPGSTPYMNVLRNHEKVDMPTCDAQHKLNVIFEPQNQDLYKLLNSQPGPDSEHKPFPAFKQLKCTPPPGNSTKPLQQ